MAGLRGQIRSPQSPVRVRRNFDNLSQQAPFIAEDGVIQLSELGVLILVLDADGGLSQSGGELAIKLDSNPGLVLGSNGLKVLLASSSGLSLGPGGLSIDLDTNPGLVLGSNGLKVLLASSSGLSLGPGGLAVLAQGVLAIDAGGIKVSLGNGLEDDGSGNLQVKVAAPINLSASGVGLDTGDGLTLDGDSKLTVDINGLDAESSPDGSADYAMIYDASAAALRKVLLNNLPGGGAAVTHVYNEAPTGTIDGVNDTFTLAATPVAGSLRLYRNGLRLTPGSDYTISGDTITFETGAIPQTGDVLLADYDVSA